MSDLQLGAVIVPAADGLLAGLGHDVRALGARALGLVIEKRKGKALTLFPELKLTLWLDDDELADVRARAAAGDAAFARLLPDFSAASAPLWVWWLSHVCHSLPVSHVLNFERGPMSELWDPLQNGDLAAFWTGSLETSALSFSVGIEELHWPQWHELEKFLQPRLLFARFLPAGMHKMEVALYLRDGAK